MLFAIIPNSYLLRVGSEWRRRMGHVTNINRTWHNNISYNSMLSKTSKHLPLSVLVFVTFVTCDLWLVSEQWAVCTLTAQREDLTPSRPHTLTPCLLCFLRDSLGSALGGNSPIPHDLFFNNICPYSSLLYYIKERKRKRKKHTHDTLSLSLSPKLNPLFALPQRLLIIIIFICSFPALCFPANK